jgi:DNA-binding transcriptional ArsR family regulator
MYAAMIPATVSAPSPAGFEPHAAKSVAPLADLFRLLGDPTRLRIVVSCLRTPLAVSDLADRLGLSVSLVSHHLRLLKGARLVRADRQGKQVYYEADDAHVRRMVEDMVVHIAEH